MAPRLMPRCALPSWTHFDPQTVQKALRCGLTTITIRTDWHTGQRDINSSFFAFRPPEVAAPG
jgi:hypothetical protein